MVNMKIKIEKVSLPEGCIRTGLSMEPFVIAARDLKCGESFVFNELTSNHRNALSIMQYAYARKYAVRKTPGTKSFRVFRIQ
jgi:hypothetical protein